MRSSCAVVPLAQPKRPREHGVIVHYLAQRAPYVALPYEAPGSGGEPAALLDVAIAAEQRKAALLSELYGAALAEGDALGAAFLRSASAQVRWTRTGDATDEPEWPESLLYSQQRKVEDVASAAILKMAGAASTMWTIRCRIRCPRILS